MKAQTVFQSWFFCLVPQPLKGPLTYVSVPLLDRLSPVLQTQALKRIFLRSEVENNGQNSDDQTVGVSNDFILADTYSPVVPDESPPLY